MIPVLTRLLKPDAPVSTRLLKPDALYTALYLVYWLIDSDFNIYSFYTGIVTFSKMIYLFQDQLSSTLINQDNFSTASKALFRLFYKPEEDNGKTLVGAASKDGQSSPIDQATLQVIYSISATSDFQL